MKLFKRLKRADHSKPVSEMYKKLLGGSRESGPVYGNSNNNFQIYFSETGIDSQFIVEISPEEARKLGERLIAFAGDYGK